MNEKIDKQAKVVVKLLNERGKKVAVAESCTGGLICAAITSVSGASSVFDMGICSYSNEIKRDKLGVSSEYLEAFGAVSEQVAVAMAVGAMNCAESDFAVSATGIAGPLGGSLEKPVGTVWIGVCSRIGKPKAQRFLFKTENSPQKINEREFIRQQTVLAALKLLEKEICEYSK